MDIRIDATRDVLMKALSEKETNVDKIPQTMKSVMTTGQDFIDAVEAYRKFGYSDRQIAEFFGFYYPEYEIGSPAYFKEYLRIQKAYARAKLVEEIENLKRKGLSFNDIAKSLGIDEVEAARAYVLNNPKYEDD